MKKAIVVLAAILIMMFAEYRYIMTHINPYYADNEFLYIEFMGQVDLYDAPSLKEIN